MIFGPTTPNVLSQTLGRHLAPCRAGNHHLAIFVKARGEDREHFLVLSHNVELRHETVRWSREQRCEVRRVKRDGKGSSAEERQNDNSIVWKQESLLPERHVHELEDPI